MPFLTNDCGKKRFKICILISSYEGVNSPFDSFGYQDPSLYVSTHDFVQVLIKKKTAKQQIEKLVKENFDYYWNFLWGLEEDAVAGVEAVKFMESLELPMLGASSKFLGMGKLDFKRAVERMSDSRLLIPKSTLDSAKVGVELQFPVIVKTTLGCGSLFLTQDSLCHNPQQLEKQVEFMKGAIEPYNKILIEEFNYGREVTVIVVETDNGTVAIDPIQYDFQDEKEFLDFNKKFKAGIKFSYLPSSPLQELLKELSCKAFEYLGVSGSGHARVDLRVTNKDEIYLLEINHTTAFFAPIGNILMDDDIVRDSYPGGHEGIVDTIINSKLRIIEVKNTFNAASLTYNNLYNKLSEIPTLLKEIVREFSYSGCILDVGCGTGVFGNIIIKENPTVEVTGIDLSPKMIQYATRYSQVYLGLVENVIMEMVERGETFDHVVTTGLLQHLYPTKFVLVFSSMFKLAKKSVTFTIEYITEAYNEKVISKGRRGYAGFNHGGHVWLNFVPKGWKIVFEDERFMWKSPSVGEKIYGFVVRLERE